MGAPIDVRVHLEARQSLPVTDGQGLDVRCIGGNIWITQAGDPRDIVLGPGQSFILDRQGLALITALLGAADLTILPERSGSRAKAAAGEAPCREPQLTHKVRLPRGDLVTIRPVCAEDAGLVQDYVRGLSNDARYDRFFGALNELPPAELDHVTRWRRPREIALLAQNPAGAEIIGEARYAIAEDGRSAEFAVSVADLWRGRGLGTALIADIQCRVRQLGVHHLVGDVLRSNVAMRTLVRKLGFQIAAGAEARSIRVVKELSAAESASPCEQLPAGLPAAA